MVCKHRLHLTMSDVIFLMGLLVKPWGCPACGWFPKPFNPPRLEGDEA